MDVGPVVGIGVGVPGADGPGAPGCPEEEVSQIFSFFRILDHPCADDARALSLEEQVIVKFAVLKQSGHLERTLRAGCLWPDHICWS